MPITQPAPFPQNPTGGFATSATANTLVDTNQAWTAHIWKNTWCMILQGTGSPQFAQISDNTATTLTMVANWNVNPDATSQYAIFLFYPSIDQTAPAFGGQLSFLTARVTADQACTANTAQSSTLAIACPLANSNYLFQASFLITNASGSSANLQIHALSNSATLLFVGTNSGNGATQLVTATATNIFTSASGTPLTVTIHGIISTSSGPTVLQIDFINPAAAGTATVKAGSYMFAYQIP